jgi:hypothetical protein
VDKLHNISLGLSHFQLPLLKLKQTHINTITISIVLSIDSLSTAF